MKKPNASRTALRSTRLPSEAVPRAGQGAGRSARGRAVAALFMTSLLVGMAGCQAASAPSPAPLEGGALGNIEQDLSAASCRQDLRSCLSNAVGGSDFAQCTLDFEGCFTQAALDRVGQGQLLSECRTPADDCLSGAIDAGDIRACGDVLGACAGDVLDQTRGVFPLVRPIVSRVLTRGVRTLRGIVEATLGVPVVALNGVRTCRDEVAVCLDDAIGDLDIRSCADGLDVCVDGVVDIIDPVLDPLPGPNGSELLTGTADCRSSAGDCLVGALSLRDIRACGDVLGACVGDAATIVDDAVQDVNDIVDPIAVPSPTDAVDCTLQLTECLARLENPFDCADQAAACAAP